MSENAKDESAVERRRPDWWALEPAVTERRDIVDEISDATGYFHDDEAAKLRDIASASGMKPVGIVRAAVEQEIEDREWKCVYFDDSEERGYISSNAYEYYRIHRAFELEYNAAVEALPKEENAHLREVQVFEHAADRLEEEVRKHRAKREQAERFLTENGHELPDVEDPRPDSDEPELVTDGGYDKIPLPPLKTDGGRDLGVACDVDDCDSRVVGIDDGWEVSRGTVCQDCLDYRDRHGHFPDEDAEICVECRIDDGAIRHECDEAAADAVILNPGSDCDYCGFEATVATDGGRVEADGELPRPPKIYDVVPLPDSERGRECTLWTGDGPTPCGNEATYLFVYEVSLDPSSDKRGNCLCCAECKPEPADREDGRSGKAVTDGGRDIDYDEPPEIPEPPMYPEWEDVETWSKANLRYPVPGGWEIADHGKFHTTWEHEDGTELSRTSKRTPGQKDTFAFTVDGEEIHSVDAGPERAKMREETVWLLQFYDENGIESVEEFEVEVRKERNQSLHSFSEGDSA